MIGHLRLSFWLVALGLIVVYAFFSLVATVSPAEVLGVAVAAVGLALALFVRTLRLTGELADRGGDPHVRRAYNHQRERRGF